MKDIQLIREDKIWNTWVLQRSDTRLYQNSEGSSGTRASLPNSQLELFYYYILENGE
jgi:hypothetical protein